MKSIASTGSLSLRFERSLSAEKPTQAGRQSHVASASGMAQVGSYLYVIPDDERHLAVFKQGSETAKWKRLVKGDLPLEFKARKGKKPDFESLVVLPPCEGYAHGALVAVPSGSKPNRMVASVLKLGSDGQCLGRAKKLDLAPLYKRISKEVPELNIEGSAVVGDRLRLFQRGVQGESSNAVIDVRLASILAAIVGSRTVPADAMIRATPIELGQSNGVDLGFSDAFTLPDGRVLFSAVAEDTTDPVQDGKFVGSAIGILGAGDQVEALWNTGNEYKIEGLTQGLAVADADDPSLPSPLLSFDLPTT